MSSALHLNMDYNPCRQTSTTLFILRHDGSNPVGLGEYNPTDDDGLVGLQEVEWRQFTDMFVLLR